MQSVKSTKVDGFVHIIGALAGGNPNETVGELATLLLAGQIHVRKLSL